MPVIVKVGVSRKLSKDFNSTGYTLDIQSELPATAAQDPESMAQATDELFRLAEDLIEAQVNKADQGPVPTPAPSQPYRQDAPRQTGGMARRGGGNGFRNTGGNGQGYRQGGAPSQGPRNNGQGNGNGNGHTGGARTLTDAQARALEKMARLVDTTAQRLAEDEFGTPLPDLTVRQASRLIDQLKQSIEAQRGEGVGR